ncbi:hypothetical protein OCA08_24315 [Bacillus cereus]|nr:hypothetical protein [Bacillus cereus]
MDFKKIPVVLKRYDFPSKMEVCQRYSRELMSTVGLIDTEKMSKSVLPWELETFALFSTIALNEYSDEKFQGSKGIRRFHQLINLIRDFEHTRLEEVSGSEKFLDYFLMVAGLNQFPIQENVYFKTYRYSYIFNFKNTNIDMEEFFVEKFGFTYKDFKEFGLILNFFFSGILSLSEMDYNAQQRIYFYILDKYQHVVQQLKVDRNQFKSIQENITKDIEQYNFGFKYFYQYPFIEYRQIIYLPLPHLVIPSVTSSLLFRLTEKNNTLRGLLGKEVLESYIIHLCNLSEMFDEVVPEYTYSLGSERRTLDVMVRQNNKCFMIDSKSMAPKLTLRDFKDKDIENTIDKLADNIVQVYQHLTERFKVEYDPFKEKVEFSKGNIFGAVVCLEDSYIRRELITKRAADKLKINYESDEYKYLCSNIWLISLYELETIIFKRKDVFQLLKENRDDDFKWFNYSLTGGASTKGVLIEEIHKNAQDAKKIIRDFLEEISNKGLLNK